MRMRRVLAIAACAAGMALVSPPSFAVPFGGVLPGMGEEANPLVHDARVFCYNRYSGRFLYWGSCRRSVPRVYCSRGGRFLHWGSCWR